jgi:putative Mn2+ efflux pump MntP
MKNFINDMMGQLWTLLGMFVAWIVLDGTAKGIVGNAILITLGVWALTYPLRREKKEEK